MEPDRVAPLRRRSDPLRRRGEPGNPRRGEVAPLGGKPRLRATKCAVVSSKRRLLFFFFFLNYCLTSSNAMRGLMKRVCRTHMSPLVPLVLN